jgi:hypothetical protein
VSTRTGGSGTTDRNNDSMLKSLDFIFSLEGPCELQEAVLGDC